MFYKRSTEKLQSVGFKRRNNKLTTVFIFRFISETLDGEEIRKIGKDSQL